MSFINLSELDPVTGRKKKKNKKTRDGEYEYVCLFKDHFNFRFITPHEQEPHNSLREKRLT